jgi:hypothetical protein
MRREDLNRYIGDRVKVTFKDGRTETGTLGFTPEFSSRYGYRKVGFYTIGNIDFKVSHIKSIYRT